MDIEPWTQDLEDAARYAARKLNAANWAGFITADDVAQELAVKMLQQPGDLADKGGRRYLFTSAKHVAIDLVRKRRDQVAPMEDDHQEVAASYDPAEDPAAIYEERWQVTQVYLYVQGLLLELPHDYYPVAHQYWWLGMSTKEAAHNLGQPHDQVRKRLERCKRLLGDAVGDLNLWREYQHPNSYKPNGGQPEASNRLKALLS